MGDRLPLGRGVCPERKLGLESCGGRGSDRRSRCCNPARLCEASSANRLDEEEDNEEEGLGRLRSTAGRRGAGATRSGPSSV